MTKKNEQIDFNRLVDSYSDDLFRFAVSRTGNADFSKDLVQETFISAFKNRAKLPDVIQMKSWLLTIMRNKIIDHFRSVSGRMDQQTVELDYRTYFNDSGVWHSEKMPSDWLSTYDYQKEEDFKSLKKLLDFCLETLSEIPAAIIRMKYLEEENADSICKTFGISSSNYWVIIHRARLRLRECIEARIKNQSQ